MTLCGHPKVKLARSRPPTQEANHLPNLAQMRSRFLGFPQKARPELLICTEDLPTFRKRVTSRADTPGTNTFGSQHPDKESLDLMSPYEYNRERNPSANRHPVSASSRSVRVRNTVSQELGEQVCPSVALPGAGWEGQRQEVLTPERKGTPVLRGSQSQSTFPRCPKKHMEQRGTLVPNTGHSHSATARPWEAQTAAH